MKTKDIIVEVAFKLFLDNGYKNTSISDLVNETGLSKGAFYHHFKNKESIYHTVIDTYFLAYYDQVDWSLADNMSVEEVELLIKEFYRSFVPEILAITEKGMSRYFILFFEVYESYPKFRDTVRGSYHNLCDLLTRKFIQNKVKNPKVEAIKLIAKYEGILFWFAIYPEEKVVEMIDAL